MELDHRASLDRLEGLVEEGTQQLRRAAALQTGMLPQSPLREEAFELAAHFTPAREISGDFYDWYRASDGLLALSVGDVMGKGLQASLMMATARAALRGAADIRPLEAGIRQAAAVMSPALEINNAYVTVFHGVFDERSGELEYVDAGHGHARLVRGGAAQELLPERSAPIGLFADSPLQIGRVTMNRGDSLVVFSDGLLDLRPDLATRDIPLPQEVRRAASAQEMVDLLAQGARDGTLNDDVTILVLKRL